MPSPRDIRVRQKIDKLIADLQLFSHKSESLSNEQLESLEMGVDLFAEGLNGIKNEVEIRDVR